MSEKKWTVIGRYQITGRLGKGGMAAVFKAYDPKFQREVAVKVLRNQYANDPRIVERFQREARAIAKLEHPAIVPIYDAGRDGDFVYIVMRYMSGGTLASKIRQSGPNGMAIEEITAVIDRVGSALDVAHSKGIIHRDVKPANVLYDQYGQPFLADFGIAKLADSTGTLTVDNIIGTPAYMSPEQVNSEKTVDGRSDLYSLGAILYEMLSGEMPYQADTTMRVAMMHVMSPIPSIVDVAPKQKKWQSIISKSMAKKAEKRYQTGRAFSNAMMKTGRTQTTPFTSVKNPGRPYIYAVLGTIGLIALTFILGWFLLNRSQIANQETLNAQETEIAQIESTRQAQGTEQAQEVAAFEATSTAFSIEAERANEERELSVQQIVSAMAALNKEACTEQKDYDFEVGRIVFKPRLGETHIEGEPFSEDIEARWTIVNEGCPAMNVRVVSVDGNRGFTPIFINSSGDGQGNAIFEGESVTMIVKLDSIEEANSIDEELRFVVEDPDGRDLQLNNVNIVELQLPEGDEWIVVITPEPLPMRIVAEVVTMERATATDELADIGSAVPVATDTPRPRPTNTRIPATFIPPTSIPPTRTPNYNATNTRQSEDAKLIADGTARSVNATRTRQAGEARNHQTREANNRKATADAFNRGATQTAEAQRAANAFKATQTKQAQDNQASAAGTRQAEQNARNSQATQTQEAINQRATLTRKAQVSAVIGTQTRQAQIQQATAKAFNAQATQTRQAQINTGNAQATRRSVAATQTQQTNRAVFVATQTQQARNVRGTRTRQAQIQQATRNAPTNTPRPANTLIPVPARPTTPPQSSAETLRITDTSCVQGGDGFVNGAFRWTGRLNANQWFAIRIATQEQSPQSTGEYVKNNITDEGRNGNNWSLTGFSTSLPPGDYSWTVALLENSNPIAFAPQTGCFSNSGISNGGGDTTLQPTNTPDKNVGD